MTTNKIIYEIMDTIVAIELKELVVKLKSNKLFNLLLIEFYL
jgi:hypothetical protein